MSDTLLLPPPPPLIRRHCFQVLQNPFGFLDGTARGAVARCAQFFQKIETRHRFSLLFAVTQKEFGTIHDRRTMRRKRSSNDCQFRSSGVDWKRLISDGRFGDGSAGGRRWCLKSQNFTVRSAFQITNKQFGY